MRTKTETKPALSQRTESPNRGMAYKPRGSRPRSPHSSLRTGKPSTSDVRTGRARRANIQECLRKAYPHECASSLCNSRRRGTGNLDSERQKGMRNAKCRDCTQQHPGTGACTPADHWRRTAGVTRTEFLESRMRRKCHVRFGGGRLEKGPRFDRLPRQPPTQHRG